ncbi:Ig-like domain-containing protein [Leisingera sp. McT4-56]|uniref:Ig-like domain-containing protein n=1 Tax=Leisingera sp. McT4-56 TaxID=2881255 RepID=UPI001CF9194E|nr:Ig-like domain-containing protein [Leisingera sp. McT4-56]MCB4458141.1 Ig-like domain-containing protein [Leisingera sp. McT4-56]
MNSSRNLALSPEKLNTLGPQDMEFHFSQPLPGAFGRRGEAAKSALENRNPEALKRLFELWEQSESDTLAPLEQNAGTADVPVDTDPGDVDQGVDALLSPYKWDTTELTYSFPDSADDYSYYPIGSFAPMTGDLQQLARAALTEYSSISMLTFTEITGDQDHDADLRIALDPDFISAYAYLPSNGSSGGDSWYGWYLTDPVSPEVGSFDFHTFLHETGHSLGLNHAHEDTHGGAVPYDLNSMEFTVMTYNSYVGSLGGAYSNSDGDFAQSLMMLDIAAIQRLYGANFAANAGDTVYSFDLDTGRMFVNGADVIAEAGLTKVDGADTVFRTIWDGNGVDTYDFSNYSTSLGVDLRPGEWVDLDTGGTFQRAHLGAGNYARGHIANALLYEGDTRSLIENAIGGSSDDWFIGNAADNKFWGGAGNDTFHDSLGSDTYFGESGYDTVSFDGDFQSYGFSAGSNFITVGSLALDWIADTVEEIRFADISWSWSDLYGHITGGSENAPPVAVDDAASTNEDTAVSISVLSNDSDTDGEAISILDFSQATNGTVTHEGEVLVYSPSQGFQGTDSFTYTISDSHGGEGTATVTVLVEPANSEPTVYSQMLTFESGTSQEVSALAVSGLNVVRSSEMNGDFAGESGRDGMFEIDAKSGEFDFDALLLQAARGQANVVIEAWNNEALVSTANFRISSNSPAPVALGEDFDGVDRIVVRSDRPILVDDIKVMAPVDGFQPAPPLRTVSELDFEEVVQADPIRVGDFDFLGATTSSQAKGVVSGVQALQSDVETISISRSDSETFDFESGYFTSFNGRNVDLIVEGWLNNTFVGTLTYSISDKKESLVLFDETFDQVDQVNIYAADGFILDDAVFLV